MASRDPARPSIRRDLYAWRTTSGSFVTNVRGNTREKLEAARLEKRRTARRVYCRACSLPRLSSWLAVKLSSIIDGLSSQTQKEMKHVRITHVLTLRSSVCIHYASGIKTSLALRKEERMAKIDVASPQNTRGIRFLRCFRFSCQARGNRDGNYTRYTRKYTAAAGSYRAERIAIFDRLRRCLWRNSARRLFSKADAI